MKNTNITYDTLNEHTEILLIGEKYFKRNDFSIIDYRKRTFSAYLCTEGETFETTVTIDSKFRITDYTCNSNKPLGYHYRYVIALCYYIREHIKHNLCFSCDDEKSHNFDSSLIELIIEMDQYNHLVYTKLEEELSNRNFSNKIYAAAMEYFVSSIADPTDAIRLVARYLVAAQYHDAVIDLVNLYFWTEKLTVGYQHFNDQLVELIVDLIQSIKQLCANVDFKKQQPLIRIVISYLENYTNTNQADLFFDLAEAIKPLVVTDDKKNKIIELLNNKKEYFTSGLNNNDNDFYKNIIKDSHQKVVALYS